MFDLTQLHDLVAEHGRVARVVVAGVKGSAPREIGAQMFVWETGQAGTVGGGALEYSAAKSARARLAEIPAVVSRVPLGPAMNQCCGGAVTLVTENFDLDTLNQISGPGFARRVEGASMMPGQMSRTIARCGAMDQPVPTLFSAGWLVEPTVNISQPVIIYGAGHVGLALNAILSPLPDFDVTLADDREIDADLTTIPVEIAIQTAQPNAHHIVMTHAHDLDLAICHKVLSRQFGMLGLIGSATKWARFKNRLIGLGHSGDHVARINCPIGEPAFGKHPQAVALGVATELLAMAKTQTTTREAV